MKVKIKHWHGWLDGFEIVLEDDEYFKKFLMAKEIDIPDELY